MQIHWQVEQWSQQDEFFQTPMPFSNRLGQWDMREEKPCWTVSPLPLKEMIPPEYGADDDLSSVPRIRPPGQPLPVVKLPSMLLDSIVCPRHDRDGMSTDGIRLMFAALQNHDDDEYDPSLFLDLRGPMTLRQLLHALWKFLPTLTPKMLSKCLNKELYLQSDGGLQWTDNTKLVDRYDPNDSLLETLASSFERSGGLKNNPVFFHLVGWAGRYRNGWYPIELRSYPPYHPPLEVDHDSVFETLCKLEVRHFKYSPHQQNLCCFFSPTSNTDWLHR